MGQKLSLAAPGNLRMILECDGNHTLLLHADRVEITGTDYIFMRRQASDKGWRRVDGGGWRGPCCPK